MSNLKNTAIAALLSCSLLTPVSPAFANQAPYTAAQSAAFASPQLVCVDQLKPAPPSTFETEVKADVVSTINGPDIREAAPYKQVGTGQLQYQDVVLSGSLFRNGGSPNVWGGATATTFYLTSDQYYRTTHTVTTTHAFDCVPFKYANGSKLIDPDGLSSTGNVWNDPIVQTVAGDDFVDHNGGPTTPVTGVTVYTLVCISPNTTGKKSAGWRGSHGISDAQCDAWQASGGMDNLNYVPSGNSPDSFVP